MTQANIARNSLAMKRALETLESVAAGLPQKPLFDQVERMVGQRLTVEDRKLLTAKMLEKEWISDRIDRITDQTVYDITDAGRTAMLAL